MGYKKEKKEAMNALGTYFANGMIEYIEKQVFAGSTPSAIYIKRYVYEYQRAEAQITFDLHDMDQVLHEFSFLTQRFVHGNLA